MATHSHEEAERLRQAAQAATDYEFYPGTELMADVGSAHLKHSGKEVLVPQPSDDPSDPVNWSRTWKWLTMSSMALTTFNWVLSPLALSPQVPFYMEDFNASLPAVINFIGVSILVLGFTNFIWVPMARGMGRRPMAILTTLLTTASCIWRATATSYNSYLGASILLGLGASPGETLGPVLIADVMFLHERGFWMGVYQWSFWGGLMIGPIISGVTADNYGWRSFWWIATAVSVFAQVWIFFFLPETKWDRRDLTSPQEPVQELTTLTAPVSEKALTPVGTIERDATPAASEANVADKLTDKPNRRQFMPFSRWQPHEPILDAFILPLKLARFPIIIWGSFQFNFAASCYLMISITQSQALGSAPYNFSAAVVGYTTLALFVGTSFSLLTAGPFSDWLSRRATTKNNGIREPEMRLPAMIPYAACMVLGTIVVAVGFQNSWPWEVIVVVGFTMLGVQVAAISGIAINYVMDCYKPAAGEFLVSATVVKNVWGYGMTKFMNDWVQEIGYTGPLLTIAACNLAFLLLGAVPLYFFGKQLRKASSTSSVHRVA